MLWLRVGPLPALLKPGSRLSIGEASIAYGDSVVEARDRYGVEKVAVLEEQPVIVKPVQPLYRPRRLSTCLVVEFEEPVFAKRVEFWVKAPYELQVIAFKEVLARVTPIKTMYTLYGDLVGGMICRYYRSRVYTEPPKPGEGEALLPVRARLADPKKLTHVVIAAEALEVYVSRDGRIVYSTVELHGSTVVTAKVVSGRPFANATRVTGPISTRQRSLVVRGDSLWWGSPTGF